MSVQQFPYKKLVLPYTADALSPYLSPETVLLNYNDVYCQDVSRLNNMLTYVRQLQSWTLPQLILFDIPFIPSNMSELIKHFAGSAYNHALYFDSLGPAGSQPAGELYRLIVSRYGSLAQFESMFTDAASQVLGSGWVWLNMEFSDNIHIAITQENLTPMLAQAAPVFVCDVWEHAYLLQVGMDISHYIHNWFQVLDWEKAERRFQYFRNKPQAYQRYHLPPSLPFSAERAHN